VILLAVWTLRKWQQHLQHKKRENVTFCYFVVAAHSNSTARTKKLARQKNINVHSAGKETGKMHILIVQIFYTLILLNILINRAK
jgi:hypothetical protein